MHGLSEVATKLGKIADNIANEDSTGTFRPLSEALMSIAYGLDGIAAAINNLAEVVYAKSN